MDVVLPPARGRIDGHIHRFPVDVYFEDTDAGGFVYHANYLRWFERARTDMLRLLGIDQRASLEAGEGTYVVTDVAMRFRAPARLGDVVMISTRLEHVGHASVRLGQAALREETKLCEASIKVGFVGPKGRPLRQPASWRQAFSPYVAEPER